MITIQTQTFKGVHYASIVFCENTYSALATMAVEMLINQYTEAGGL